MTETSEPNQKMSNDQTNGGDSERVSEDRTQPSDLNYPDQTLPEDHSLGGLHAGDDSPWRGALTEHPSTIDEPSLSDDPTPGGVIIERDREYYP
jgi:hypothetical protein